MKEYAVYILLCADESYYTGITNNLERRITEHQSGMFGGYTHTRRPVTLVYSQHFEDVWEAIAAEKQIKGWRRVKKQALINGNYDELVRLSKGHASTGST